MTQIVSKLGFATAASLALTGAAHAHDGDHSAPLLANIIHWLSSPSHAFFAVVGGVVLSAVLIKIIRKSRA